MAVRYISIKEYADKYKISVQAVYKAIKAGRLKSSKKSGKTVVDGDADLSAIREQASNISGVRKNDDAGGNSRAVSLNQRYQEIKIQKLESDIELQKQKLEQRQEELLREFCEQVIEAYQESFAVLKNELIALRLPPDKLKVLRNLIGKCTGNFVLKLQEMRVKPDVEKEE